MFTWRYLALLGFLVFQAGWVASVQINGASVYMQSFEESESSFVLEIAMGTTGVAIKGIRSAAKLLQYTSDTVTNVFSASAKSMGSLMKLGDGVVKDNCVSIIGTQLQLASHPDVIFHRLLCVCFSRVSRVIGYSSNLMLLVGDVNEAIFVGLSHSIDDSIQGLIFMLIQIRSGIRLLLLPASFQKEGKIGKVDSHIKDVKSHHRGENEVEVQLPIESGREDDDFLLNRGERVSLKISQASIPYSQERQDRERDEGDGYFISPDVDYTRLKTREAAFLPILGGTTFTIFFAMMIAYIWGTYPFAEGRHKKVWFLILLFAIGGMHFALQRNEHAHLYEEYALRGAHDYVKSLQPNADLRGMRQNSEEEMVRWEQSVWTNTLIKSLWNTTVDEPQTEDPRIQQQHQQLQHGLGSYASDIISKVIHDELGAIPDGLGNLKLAKFHLGSDAPLVKAIRCLEGKKNVCLSGDLSCAYAIMDTKFSYASRNVDISFAMKSKDMSTKSLLPEVSVIISEIFFVGTVRVKADVTPSYPFFGNATVGFLGTPVCDVIITLGPEFRNIHISSIPGVHQLMKSSLEWMMSQYVYPKYGTLELGKILCPTCDSERGETEAAGHQAHHHRHHSPLSNLIDQFSAVLGR